MFFLVKKRNLSISNLSFVHVRITVNSEHKKIPLYLDKKFYGKLLYATLNQKVLGEFLHCFCNENKKKSDYCDDYDNCIHCKKLKYRHERLDSTYYFSPRKDAL